jgi:hypothetical protein
MNGPSRPDDRRPLLADALARALSFLAELPDRPVAPHVDLRALRDAMGGPLAERGVPAGDVLARLDDTARPALVANAGPRFFGFVIGGVHPVALATDWLVSTWDANHGLYVLSPAASVAWPRRRRVAGCSSCSVFPERRASRS